MKSDHPLEALAMDLAGGSLKIAGTVYPLGRITFDPGNRLPGDRPALLVTVHAPAEPDEAPCNSRVQDFAGTAPARDSGLLATGAEGKIRLAGLQCKAADHWHAAVTHESLQQQIVVGCGKTPAEATAHAAAMLKKLLS